MPQPTPPPLLTALDDEMQGLVRDIVNGRCVLFLGPELMVNGQGRYYKDFFRELAASDANVYHYFEKDNLFSIAQASPVKRRMLIDDISEFYQASGDAALLGLIAEVPFPLVINVGADLGINAVLDQKELSYQYYYYSTTDRFDVPKPTVANPVVYSIFGSVQESRSLILTHLDLFRTIKELMQKDSLPANIYTTLRSANSFLFLGLQFDTWYYQMLLSIFDMDKVNDNNLLIGPSGNLDDDTVSIMSSSFRINFKPQQPIEIMQQIHAAVGAKDKLRVPAKKPPQTQVYVSYAWKDDLDQEREDFVNVTDKQLRERYGVALQRDKSNMTAGDSIGAFMEGIGLSKAVLMVISDKYLKSEYCMYEAWRVYHNANFDERVFISFLPGLQPEPANYYGEFWNAIRKNLEAERDAKTPEELAAAGDFIERLERVTNIQLFVRRFIAAAKDRIYYQAAAGLSEASLLADAQYISFMDGLVQKLRAYDAQHV